MSRRGALSRGSFAIPRGVRLTRTLTQINTPQTFSRHLTTHPLGSSFLYVLFGKRTITLLDPFTLRVHAKHALRRPFSFPVFRGRFFLLAPEHSDIVAVDWLTGEERVLLPHDPKRPTVDVLACGTMLMQSNMFFETAALRRLIC